MHFIVLALNSHTMLASPTPDIITGVGCLHLGDTHHYITLLLLLGRLTAATGVGPFVAKAISKMAPAGAGPSVQPTYVSEDHTPLYVHPGTLF